MQLELRIKAFTMENTNTPESLRLLSNAHAISWSFSDEEKAASNKKTVSLMTPLERSVPRHYGLIQSKVVRERNVFKMYLEFLGNSCHLIYSAEKTRTGSYVIFDGTAGTSLGSLSKISTNGSTVGYSLEVPDDTRNLAEVAKILYEVPSILHVLKDSPPRRAHVIVHGIDSVETKEPSVKGGGQRGLNFYGRGREPSCKNMQLQSRTSKVVLQMVKWEKDVFHLDYNFPFDKFHAFGFALAQFVL